ncbi:hypothetical protein A6024_07190 [Rhodovulum sulfidophilum]|nr:hypothetical protein A6W98_07335 [Rhodovulum sulfidophilum DSM 1374]ANB37722.1 hypothetical protein A6024_07190 [Rhodovulum sulfidophilum]
MVIGIRKLLIVGMTSRALMARKHPERADLWTAKMLAQKPFRLNFPGSSSLSQLCCGCRRQRVRGFVNGRFRRLVSTQLNLLRLSR